MIITEKEEVLKLHPAAYCSYKSGSKGIPFWLISDGIHGIALSFESEEKAWKNALSNTYRTIIRKFGE